jgi:hypothetical protein
MPVYPGGLVPLHCLYSGSEGEMFKLRFPTVVADERCGNRDIVSD